MFGIANGEATWDWQLKKFFARVDGQTHLFDTIDELGGFTPLTDVERADLEIYRMTCEANQ